MNAVDPMTTEDTPTLANDIERAEAWIEAARDVLARLTEH
jgi:hypothetical protein